MVHSVTPELNKGDDRPSVYFDPEVERWVYRASALGSCERELVLHRRGMTGSPTPDWLQVRFDEGHDWETRILDRFVEDQGTPLRGFQARGALLVGKHAMVRGSIDAETDDAVVDAKFLGPDLYRKLIKDGIDAFPHYAWQQAVYAHAMEKQRVCLAMGLKEIEGEGDDRVIVGIAEMHYLWVELKDLPTIPQIKARVMRLEKLAQGNDLPACPVPFPYPCPFDYMHDEVDTAIEVKGEGADLLQSAAELDRAIRILEAETKKLKAERNRQVEITLELAGLAQTEGHKLKAGGVEVTWIYSHTPAAVIEKYERKASTRAYPKFKTNNEEQ
jgi:uncharacterized small protein (DUF1192 family)